MATAWISPATSISFVLDTGAGKIWKTPIDVEQAFHYDDKLPSEPDFASYYDRCQSETEFRVINPCQLYLCDDQPSFQIFHASNDESPWSAAQASNPVIALMTLADDLTTIVSDLLAESLADTPGVKFTVRDLTLDEDACDQCVRIVLYTLDTSEATNDWPCADSGTWEASGAGAITGGNNAIARQGLIVRTGSWAGEITANAVPAGATDEIYECSSSYSFTQGDIITIRTYVKELSTAPNFLGASDECYFDISDFSDASTLSDTRAEPQNNEDTWQLVQIVFQVGADTTGGVRLKSTSTAQASGRIYVDDSETYITATTRQAVSQCLEFRTDVCDTLMMTYSASSWSFGQVWGSGISFSNSVRLGWPENPVRLSEFRFVEDKGEVFRDSAGQGSVTGMRTVKVRKLTLANVPPYLVEKLTLAVKHEIMTIGGISYVAFQKDVDPIWIEKNDGLNASMEIEITPVDYDQKEDLCT